MNQELQATYSLTDRLYFNEFAIYKRTISANFEHPLLKKAVCHKFHLATLEQHQSQEKFMKRLKDFRSHFRFHIDKTDKTDELILFKVEPKNRQNYFFFEILDGKKRLPLYYAAIYTSDCFEDSISEPSKPRNVNWADYIKSCDEEIAHYIYGQTIHPSCIYDLFDFFHDFGFYIYEWLLKEDPEYIDEPQDLDASWLDECHQKFEKIEEPAMRNYALAVVESVFQKAYQDHEIMQCQFCNRYIDYVKNKKYCSFISENRDCGKRARNKRNYQKHREKIITKAIRANKELRDFYKEKGIKK